MKVQYSKEFVKAVERLSGKQLNTVIDVINNVIDAGSLADISNCKKIVSLANVYRIRIGDLRAFFYIVMQDDNIIRFEYLVSRGKVYSKSMMERLRMKDK